MSFRPAFSGRSVTTLAVAAGLLLTMASQSAAQQRFDIKEHYQKYEYQIPMRDGVKLFTSVYVPRDSSTTYPLLVVRTPYSAAPYGPDAYSSFLGRGRPGSRR